MAANGSNSLVGRQQLEQRRTLNAMYRTTPRSLLASRQQRRIDLRKRGSIRIARFTPAEQPIDREVVDDGASTARQTDGVCSFRGRSFAPASALDKSAEYGAYSRGSTKATSPN